MRFENERGCAVTRTLQRWSPSLLEAISAHVLRMFPKVIGEDDLVDGFARGLSPSVPYFVLASLAVGGLGFLGPRQTH